VKVLIMPYSPVSCYALCVGSQYSHRHRLSNTPNLYNRADESMARVPKVASGKISLSRVIRCCPNFLKISFALPASLYVKNVFIYTYLTV
jgi:hypothetical protein